MRTNAVKRKAHATESLREFWLRPLPFTQGLSLYLSPRRPLSFIVVPSN